MKKLQEKANSPQGLDAAEIQTVLEAFAKGQFTRRAVVYKRAVKKNATKRKSFEETLCSNTAISKVYDAIWQNPSSSRSEIANICGLRLSTVCGAVNRLYKQDLIRVCGTKFDNNSLREVETLSPRIEA